MYHMIQKNILLPVILIWLTTQAIADESKYIIGFPEDNMSNDWRAAQMAQIKQELAQYKNIKFLMSDAGGSIAKNILDIENMERQGVQLLFLAPKNPAAIVPIVARLRKKGIRIILLTRKLNNNDYDVYISPDDFKIAYNAAVFMAEHLKGNGKILMLEGVPTTSTSMRRKQGFIAGLNNYPGIKIISKIANYSRSKAITVVGELINNGKKFDAIYAHNDAMAAGARFVLKQSGINPATIPTVGIDFLPETRDAIIKGEQLASFTYPTCGKIGVDTALKILQGKKTPRYISVPSQMVTKKNAANIKTVY